MHTLAEHCLLWECPLSRSAMEKPSTDSRLTFDQGPPVVGPPHGSNSNCTAKRRIRFGKREMIVRIEGKTRQKVGYVSQLTFFTRSAGGQQLTYGLFGRGGDSDIPFSIAGAVIAFFGVSGQFLDAVGVYYASGPHMPPGAYNQSALIGGTGGHSFDDFLALNGSSRIKKIVVRYGASIDGIQVTYWDPNAPADIITNHGTFSQNTLQQFGDGFVDLASSEWITQVDISSGLSKGVDYLFFRTTNAAGQMKSYGPFGSKPLDVPVSYTHLTLPTNREV